jgi:solute:Na+ symporter, SSS family
MPTFLPTLADAASRFTWLDWNVLLAYVATLVGTGIYFARRAKRTTADYFLGGHQMPVWAVAISILATAQSAATFVGAPESAYRGDLTYLSTNIGGMLAALVLASFFIPRYYALNASTPYQLLQSRFGSDARLATSWAYMIGRVFASGARVYVGAIPVAWAVFGAPSDSTIDPTHLYIAIVAFMVFGVLYTLAGGISSVIWTDVFQVCVYLGAAVVAAIIIFVRLPYSASEAAAVLSSGMPDGSSKLTLINFGLDFSKPGWGFDPAAEFTLLTALTGWTLITLASHGMDQDLVQRLLTCTNARKGSWSVISGVLIGIPVVLLFLVVGSLLWLSHHAAGETTTDAKDVFIRYILTNMPAGAAGLMIAGVLAAGPAGINASLNSMASTFVEDVYKPRRAGRDERHYVRVGRLATAGWGMIIGLFALVCVRWQRETQAEVLPFVLGVMGFAYAGLLGVFFTALFTKRGNASSAVLALLTGFGVVSLLQPYVWRYAIGYGAMLPDWLGGGVIQAFLRDNAWFTSLSLASPWRLVIGTIIATIVCCLGSPRRAEGARP